MLLLYRSFLKSSVDFTGTPDPSKNQVYNTLVLIVSSRVEQCLYGPVDIVDANSPLSLSILLRILRRSNCQQVSKVNPLLADRLRRP